MSSERDAGTQGDEGRSPDSGGGAGGGSFSHVTSGVMSGVMSGVASAPTVSGLPSVRDDEALLLLRAIVEHVPIMLFVKDARDLRMRIWNRASEELTGVAAGEIVGLTDFDLFPAEQARAFQARDREALETGRLIEIEEPLSTRRGLRWLRTRKIPLRDGEGVPRYLLGISEDITERRHADEALEKALEAAAAGSRAKSQFLAMVGHELRTPLTLILGPLDLLISDDDLLLPPWAREQLSRARRSAMRLRDLLTDLLDVAKSEAGQMRVRREPCAPGALLSSIIDETREAASQRGVELSLAPPGEGELSLDRRMFERIVINLLTNAIKFTPAGGKVCVLMHIDEGGLSLEVRDTGIGIAPDDIPLLFQRFTQLDASTSRRFEGTGLGLSLVREFAVLMGGSVDVSSAPGEGSTFRVWLPRVPSPGEGPRAPDERPQAGMPPVTSPRAGDAAPSEGRPTLLVADGNEEMRAHLVDVLGDDFRVIAEADGPSALRRALAQPPAVVLADVMLPGLDGFTLLERLHDDARTRFVPVVLLSATPSEETVVRALDRGAYDHVQKPFAPRELRARLRAALRHAQRLAPARR